MTRNFSNWHQQLSSMVTDEDAAREPVQLTRFSTYGTTGTFSNSDGSILW